MPQINFNDILSQLESGLANLAKNSLKDYLAAAETDGRQILTSLSTDLQNWTNELANGDITPNNFVYLATAKKDLITMDALKQAGLAEIKIDQFKDDALQLITSTIIGLIP